MLRGALGEVGVEARLAGGFSILKPLGLRDCIADVCLTNAVCAEEPMPVVDEALHPRVNELVLR